MPAVTIFVAYAPTSGYNEEEVEAFSMDSEKFYREDYTFYKPVIDWDLFISLAGIREDAVADSIDEECDGLVQRLRDSAKKAEGQEPPRGACLSRPSSLYASVELREPQATTS
ncbi:hypothetical protein ANCDUO_22753 [Ancylostoma duodenale]|uniref:Uncharacterized protein n=1 Tax=Ancylostoma duodenale TaxID=51022 RepID=A0A0C2FF17_9BILA|nr:hypothetical protein ANCDUO_22753 [Ancylostoma duodenale]